LYSHFALIPGSLRGLPKPGDSTQILLERRNLTTEGADADITARIAADALGVHVWDFLAGELIDNAAFKATR